jgi:16S rRNA (cytosine967-C5)-methyltransferase
VIPQQLAAEAVCQVLSGRSLTATLEKTLTQHESLSAADRGALWDMAHGALRYLGLLQALVAHMVRRPVIEPGLEALLVVALYRLEFTRTPAYAVVSQAVDVCVAAGWPWAKGMVNALLRRFQRERLTLLEIVRRQPRALYSYPEWWIDRVRRDYPSGWERLLEAGNQSPRMALRVNRRRDTVSSYIDRLRAVGIEARALGDVGVVLDRIVPVHRLPGFADGLVSVQDMSAQWAAPLLDLSSGQRVLDAFSAPGGKTAHILELAEVNLVSLDNDSARLARVRANLLRLKLDAEVRHADAAAVSEWWDGRGFDRVLADLPCTASGVVRRHPDIKWLRRDDDVTRLAAQAARLLDSLWRVVVPGGKLLIVTCSVFQEENRAQVDDFVGRHADARIEPLSENDGLDLQLLPDESHDGFYFARIERRP